MRANGGWWVICDEISWRGLRADGWVVLGGGQVASSCYTGCGARAAECRGWLHCVGSSTPHSLQTRGQHNTCHHHVGIVGSKGTVEMNWVTSACPNIEGGCI